MSTTDPLAAVLDMLAACREQLTVLDDREASHHAAASGQLAALAQAIQEHAAVLAGLTASGPSDAGGYCPAPSPAWWDLPPEGRREPAARLGAWVERVYRPGYGHLAAGLGPCWASHDLCLYGLDILSQLWSVLYLQSERSTGLLSAQGEFQARILPALASQLRAETTGCGHNPATRQRRGMP